MIKLGKKIMWQIDSLFEREVEHGGLVENWNSWSTLYDKLLSLGKSIVGAMDLALP